MKLRNKKTGEIRNIKLLDIDDYLVEREVTTWKGEPLSLAVLKAEWEDVTEEPIQVHIEGIQRVYMDGCGRVFIDYATAEEAEKAMKKLKAWKRLKDKGFRFSGHDDRDRGQLGDIVIYAEMSTFEYDDDSARDDLDLLFGGEK